MSQEDKADVEQLVRDAVAAFDAANLAWGQFYREVWVTRPEEDRVRAVPVREALGETALSVPVANGAAEIEQFAAALLTAHDSMLRFLDRLSPEEAGNLREIPQAVLESYAYLKKALTS